MDYFYPIVYFCLLCKIVIDHVGVGLFLGSLFLLMLKLSHLWLVRAALSCFLSPFDIPLESLIVSQLSNVTEHSRPSYTFAASGVESTISPKSPVSSLRPQYEGLS